MRPAPALARLHRLTPQGVLTAAVVVAAALFTLVQLQPGLLVTDNTPAGGDMGAHVWGPAYLRDHLLPNGRLSGWTPDWYAGFPAFQFYFPLPALLIVLLDLVLPYGIAFKLVSVSGVVLMPVAAWAFGRLAGLRFPGPACLAVATLPFLFDRTFSIYGGNVASTLAGEYSFSIALSLGLVFLGVWIRGLETGRHRALAAGLLAVTGLCHVIPTFFVLAAAAIITLFRLDRQRLRWAVPVLAVAGLLAAFWILPFLGRLAYTNDMGWEKIGRSADGDLQRDVLTKNLFPFTSPCGTDGCQSNEWGRAVTNGFKYASVLAVAGAVVAVGRRRRVGLMLVALAAASAVAFVYAPQGRLWNARILPFWFLSIYLLAGFGVGELGRLAALALSRDRDPDAADHEPGWPLLASAGTVVLGLLLTLGLLAPPLQQGRVLLLPATTDRSFIRDWARWNYSGYEGKAAYPEYRNVVSVMERIGKEHGCGRAMWEYEPELDRYGTPMALMLLPYWTDGCVGSMEGLFFESSATTPYHFLNQSELSLRPSCAQRDLPYRNCGGQRDPKVDEGVEHLQLLGVRYYMALTDESKAKAAANPDLELLAATEPFSVSYTDNGVSTAKPRSWAVYRVADSDLVAPLSYEPAVLTGVPKGGEGWLDVAVAFYQDASRWAVPLAADGPDGWARVEGDEPDPPRRAIEPATVTNIRAGDDTITFDVDEPGRPVLVKASYFPNWQASGAQGPWRVTPNLMVVVPTERHVELRYGRTSLDWFSIALSGLGLAGLVLLARLGPVPMPRRRHLVTQRDGWPPPTWPPPGDEAVANGHAEPSPALAAPPPDQ